ncbi:MAG: hypothetical protein M3096_02900 [Actinomycetia bacterium]|nr:hypothetical protein [Actinomycetes bacterium]
MRKAAIVFAVLAIMMIPVAALATPPEVVDEGEFDYSFLNDEMTAECGFDVYTAAEGSYKVTEFSNKDGDPVRMRIHETGKVLWTSADGEAWENYAVNVDIDLATGIETLKGNVWNLHAGAGGILVNDSGRIILAPDGEGGYESALTINGPHQAWYEEFDAMCEALS